MDCSEQRLAICDGFRTCSIIICKRGRLCSEGFGFRNFICSSHLIKGPLWCSRPTDSSETTFDQPCLLCTREMIHVVFLLLSLSCCSPSTRKHVHKMYPTVWLELSGVHSPNQRSCCYCIYIDQIATLPQPYQMRTF